MRRSLLQTTRDCLMRRALRAFPDVQHITVEELAHLMDAGDPDPVLLDVRDSEEFATSHLPDAVLAQPGMSDDELLRLLPADRPIVTYCSIGYRSALAARRLAALGFEDVRNLEGSIFRWAALGYPVMRAGEHVREVHPYNRTWGLLLPRRLRAPASARRGLPANAS